ncbi:MAG: ribonucleoside triphosphate reductase [Rickettsiales bacterium]|jgi:ribonucleoside-triphosphate reductase|nr:ribonucleoside triphosphate reductase [Rickettsiales bacterium]
MNRTSLLPAVREKIATAFKKSNEGSLSEFYRILDNEKVFDREALFDIQAVEQKIKEVLAKNNLTRTLEEYIKIAIEKKQERDTKVSSKISIQEYIDKEDWRINANANTGYSNAGMINNIAGKLVANYWLDAIYSEEEANAHRDGDYHIHDLDCLTGYCAGWSLRQLLDEGFNGVKGRVSAQPPRHFRTALGQMANFLGILQSEWAGAQAFSSFDTYLAPYVFKDKMTVKQIKQDITSFVYNLNVPARWGQSPFTNVTMDFTVPDDLKDQIPTSEGIHLFKGLHNDELLAKAKQRGLNALEDMTYKHFQNEIEMIDIAFYEVMTAGDREGQPFTFPIPTVNMMEDFNWDSPAATALFENTAKVGSSYFQNFIGSQYMKNEKGEMVPNPEAYKPNAVRSMCCRLRLDLRELLKRGNGLFGSAEMTGSIGVVTINMARLGYLCKDNKDALYYRLDMLMDYAKSTLEKKRVFVQDLYERGFYPYTKRYLRGFKNHFSTIGVNGMNEMVRNFTHDKDEITSESGINLCTEILEHIREKMRKYQEETGNLYNLEATPAEGTTYRFAKIDKRKFPDIIQAGFGDNIYYTNSSQVPANFTDDPFEALDLQNDLQCKYTGGTVLHLYMSERLPNGEAAKKLVKKVLDNYKLPNFTITPVFSVCSTHGYLDGEQQICPHCNKKTQVWTRVMGYHRPFDSFNIGKKGEHMERVMFRVSGGC